MATQSRTPAPPEVDYPTGDGKPVGEAPRPRDLLLETVHLLGRRFADEPMMYVSGNMLMYYVRGDKRKHVCPDVFVTLDIPYHDDREAYFVWEEGKGPDFVIEFTSKSTRREDERTKFSLYRDVLKVREYILFDPYDEYLKPRLKGYRLVGPDYLPIAPIAGRLPSEVIGLHLEPAGDDLRLFDPATGRRVPNIKERDEALDAARAEREQAILRQGALEVELRESRAEADRLRRELERLRRGPDEAGG